ncbi:MAG TPA: nucleoside monophosphate kinase [Candidatus Rhabdochlamydia sp.]|nr:nucleoside monophosphate kinase [Candidatus Rhabdochlamydia sp.]
MSNFLIFGSPGSGKGTVCEVMARRGYTVLSMGTLLRKYVRDLTPLGKKIEQNVYQSILIPDTIACELMEDEIKKRVAATEKPFVIEGFPSTIIQYQLFIPTFKKYNLKVLYLKCRPDLAIERITSRMMCQVCEGIYNLRSNPPHKQNICDRCESLLVRRSEDNLSLAKKRIETFQEKTYPILNEVKVDHILNNNSSHNQLLAQVTELLDEQRAC